MHFAIARCQGIDCDSATETHVVTNANSFTELDVQRLSGTLLGNGSPAFVLGDSESRVAICPDAICMAPPVLFRPLLISDFTEPTATRTIAGSVGPDGALRIVRRAEVDSNFLEIRYIRCRDTISCLPYHRPR